jgi:hypothetical protein
MRLNRAQLLKEKGSAVVEPVAASFLCRPAERSSRAAFPKHCVQLSLKTVESAECSARSGPQNAGLRN